MRPGRRLSETLGALALLGGGLLGCARPPSVSPTVEQPAGPAWFTDVTAEVGLDFVHDPGPVGHFFMPQIMGAGAALFDFDNDGRLDIYLVQSAGPDSPSKNRLFRQGADGRFTDVSRGSGLDVSGYCLGVAVGDIDNEGWRDVLATEYGGLRLFRNNGNGTFTDIS